MCIRDRPVAVIAIAVATVSVLPCFPFLATWGTTLRLVSIASWRKLFLFLSAESEGSPTIGTLDRLVLKTHWMTPSLRNFSWSSGHPILEINLRGFKEACNNLNWNHHEHHTLKEPHLQERATNFEMRGYPDEIQGFTVCCNPNDITCCLLPHGVLPEE